MTAFEYDLLIWDKSEDETRFLARLNAAGADGWEAVGMESRGASVPMPGMGAKAVPEIVVVLKRRLAE